MPKALVKELQKCGHDMKKLSVVGKDYHSKGNVVGYYNTGDRMATWGEFDLFWGWIWGMLFGSAFFLIPGMSPVMVGGPLVSYIIGALVCPDRGRFGHERHSSHRLHLHLCAIGCLRL